MNDVVKQCKGYVLKNCMFKWLHCKARYNSLAFNRKTQYNNTLCGFKIRNTQFHSLKYSRNFVMIEGLEGLVFSNVLNLKFQLPSSSGFYCETMQANLRVPSHLQIDMA